MSSYCNIRPASFMLFAMLSMQAGADESTLTDDQLIAMRPVPDLGPTEIRIDLYLLDIKGVNDAEQLFDVDMFLDVSWHDPRLALPESRRNGTGRVIPIEEIWSPRGAIVNDRGLDAQLPDVAIVDDSGNVLHQQRYYGSLAARMSFYDFPFDRQVLPIQIASYFYNPDEVRFSEESALHFPDEAPTAEGWRFAPGEAAVGVLTVPGGSESRPKLTVSLDAKRKGAFYLLTMFLPMTLIVFMAWTVTLLPQDVVPPRIGIATASIFSVVAMGFTVRIGLPPISYLTLADIYVVGCTLLVFARLGFLVAETRFVKDEQADRAARVGTAANRLYVGMFALLIIFTVLVRLL